MTAEKKKQIIIIISCVVVALIAAIVAFILLFGKKEDGYRVIKLYQIEGTATLDRPGVGSMDATENVAMQNKDVLSVMDKSFVRLQMDSDKYALAEENTVLSIEATGDEKANKTNIKLQSGAVTVEIQNKLGSESSYQVTTPNSVMAVRGTVFRVAVTTDENGKPKAKLDVFEGTVTVQRINKNEKGEEYMEEEIYTAEKGGQIIVYFSDDEEENIVYVNEEPDYSDIPVETLYFLQEIVDERDLIFTEEEIQEMIDALLEEEEQEPEVEEEEVIEEEIEEEPEIEDVIEEEVEEEEEVVEASTKPETKEEVKEETPAETTPAETTPEEEETTTTYTITFTYNGAAFATQTVEEGGKVSKPSLQPAVSGSWDFDFATEITADTTIEWK